MKNIIFDSLTFKILIPIVLFSIILVYVVSEKLFSKKYISKKKIDEEVIKISELENLIYDVLRSWDQDKIISTAYSEKLIHIHDKEMLSNYRKGKSWHFGSAIIEGIYNLKKINLVFQSSFATS